MDSIQGHVIIPVTSCIYDFPSPHIVGTKIYEPTGASFSVARLRLTTPPHLLIKI